MVRAVDMQSTIHRTAKIHIVVQRNSTAPNAFSSLRLFPTPLTQELVPIYGPWIPGKVLHRRLQYLQYVPFQRPVSGENANCHGTVDHNFTVDRIFRRDNERFSCRKISEIFRGGTNIKTGRSRQFFQRQASWHCRDHDSFLRKTAFLHRNPPSSAV